MTTKTKSNNTSGSMSGVSLEAAFMLPGLADFREKVRKTMKSSKKIRGRKRKLARLEALNKDAQAAYYVLNSKTGRLKPHSGQI